MAMQKLLLTSFLRKYLPNNLRLAIFYSAKRREESQEDLPVLLRSFGVFVVPLK